MLLDSIHNVMIYHDNEDIIIIDLDKFIIKKEIRV